MFTGIDISNPYTSYKKYSEVLEETLNLARLGIDVDVQVSRRSRKAGDGLDVGGEGVPVIVFSVD